MQVIELCFGRGTASTGLSCRRRFRQTAKGRPLPGTVELVILMGDYTLRAALLRMSQRATRLYSEAVNNLANKVTLDGISKAEYFKLFDAAEQARQASMDAYDQLQRHVAKHSVEIQTETPPA